MTPIDPRMRSRRVVVAREEGRRRLRILVAGVGASVLVLGSYAALQSPLLDVDRVVVEGASRLDPTEVLGAVSVERGSALADVDEGEVARRVETLPWVARAQVRRHWPGTLRVLVTERAPAAVVREEAGDGPSAVAVLDGQGRVLSRGPAPVAGLDALVRLEGVEIGAAAPGESVAAAVPLLAVAARLPADLAPAVAAVVADPGGVSLRLAPSGVVRLGSADRLGEKLQALRTLLVRVDLDGLETMDLREPARPTLTRR